MKSMLQDWLTHKGLSEGAAEDIVNVGTVVLLILVAWLADLIVQRVSVAAFQKWAGKTKAKWDDFMVRRGVFHRGSHIVSALILHGFAPAALAPWPGVVEAVRDITAAYLILVIVTVLDSLLVVSLDVYQSKPGNQRVILQPVVQAARIVLWTVGSIMILAALVDKSPLVLFSGLGAMAAVLMLIFRDPILGFVAGVQIAANDLVREGDWIEMPEYNADGDVLDVGLTTIKVQNWNKTISSIPTYALVSDSFKNWRGMSDSGGRRIKRSISLDMNSIALCDEEMIGRFKKIEILQDYIDKKQTELEKYNSEHKIDDSELVNGRRMTNLGTFRAYLVGYLRRHPKISNDMTLLVRQLQPTAQGLPMEIYVFSNDQRWVEYEGIQSDIFDHVLAVVPQFYLRVYQEPSGRDFSALAGGGMGAEASAGTDTAAEPAVRTGAETAAEEGTKASEETNVHSGAKTSKKTDTHSGTKATETTDTNSRSGAPKPPSAAKHPRKKPST